MLYLSACPAREKALSECFWQSLSATVLLIRIFLFRMRSGKNLYEIIRDDGVERFCKLENQINRELIAQRTVVATGGSVIYHEEAMAHLKSIGTVVFLDVPERELEKRIGDFSKRGVLIKNGDTFNDLYRERMPLYLKYADLTVICNENDLVKNAEKIMAAIGK